MKLVVLLCSLVFSASGLFGGFHVLRTTRDFPLSLVSCHVTPQPHPPLDTAVTEAGRDRL